MTLTDNHLTAIILSGVYPHIVIHISRNYNVELFIFI